MDLEPTFGFICKVICGSAPDLQKKKNAIQTTFLGFEKYFGIAPRRQVYLSRILPVSRLCDLDFGIKSCSLFSVLSLACESKIKYGTKPK